MNSKTQHGIKLRKIIAQHVLHYNAEEHLIYTYPGPYPIPLILVVKWPSQAHHVERTHVQYRYMHIHNVIHIQLRNTSRERSHARLLQKSGRVDLHNPLTKKKRRVTKGGVAKLFFYSHGSPS